MKTKLAFAALLLMIGVAQVRASVSTPSLTISRKGESAIFLVKYVGSQSTDLNLKIKDGNGNVLVSEYIKDTKGFSLPVNLEGVSEGVYTVEVGDKTIKQVGTLDYTIQNPGMTSHVTDLGDNRYLLSVAHPGTERIVVRILNEAGDAVFEEVQQVYGDFAQVFDLPKFSGNPSFEVTELSGSALK